MSTDNNKRLKHGTLLDGVSICELHVNRDVRGTFTEIFYDTWNLGVVPAQWSVVASQPHVLRGMHLHLRHDEYICLLQGRALVGLYDLREDASTYSKSCIVELDADEPACLSFPRRILHGWYFFEPSLHVQAVSETYAAYGEDDNWGCRFDDPALNLPWPDARPVLSERAASFPRLNALRGQLAAFERSAASDRNVGTDTSHVVDSATSKSAA